VTAEIDWGSIFRRVVARQRELFAETTSIADRTVYEGRGEGGDMTLELDRRCEDAVFAELESLADSGASLLVISEERGEVEIGPEPATGDRTRVVVDPIDGSMNVRRTIPFHSLSIAVADGPTMADVTYGFVHDFGADEEFVATLGGGATLDGQPLPRLTPGKELEVIGLESAEPGWIAGPIRALEGKAYRLRVVGSIAITLSYVAAGRFDGMLSARTCRSVDAAAAQLILRESGGSLAFGDVPLEQARLDLEDRFPIVGAADDTGLRTLLDARVA
jgi:myo-inositol-1(or 4)-monophosphatase